MKLRAILAAAAMLACSLAWAQLPAAIHLEGHNNHIQGFTVDLEEQCIYASFTTSFYKTDFNGNIIASVENIPGHLGAMSRNPKDGKVYASLEFKDDEIGQGIAKGMGIDVVKENTFYIAIIDVAKMDRMDMDPYKDDVMKLVRIEDACRDYAEGHRYGCSGIDGVTFAPKFGKKGGKMYLYVAYGIYAEKEGDKNDDQVLLCFDPEHFDGAKPLQKLFVRTGNTNWGVQNMAFDRHTGRIFLLVYKGSKPQFPNYDMFALDIRQKPRDGRLQLASDGQLDKASGIRGWRFKWGSTGFCPLGDGQYVISENGRNPQTKQQCSDLRLYRWTGNADKPFEYVEK